MSESVIMRLGALIPYPKPVILKFLLPSGI